MSNLQRYNKKGRDYQDSYKIRSYLPSQNDNVGLKMENTIKMSLKKCRRQVKERL
jgi:hypothetical protein